MGAVHVFAGSYSPYDLHNCFSTSIGALLNFGYFVRPGEGRSEAQTGCRGHCLGQAYEPWQA